MKNLFGFILLTLVVVSCGAPSGHFRLEGHLQNFNQGEFYLYGLDGRGRLDTIPVVEGRFSFEAPIEEPSAYSLVFPNFSEVPIFAESGATVKLEGDASRLKEVKVGGTNENDLMTAFRLKIAEATPPQAIKEAEAFIHTNPSTASSLYLLNKYFVMKIDPDYKKAVSLCAEIVKAQPKNEQVVQLSKQLKELRILKGDQQLPSFSAIDINGQRVTNASLTGELNIITVWATWNYESGNLMRQLRLLKKEYGGRLGLLSISVDANKNDCRNTMDRDSLTWNIICDGQMLDTPVLTQLGIADVPYNLLTDRSGKILAVNLDQTQLKIRIKRELK
jgi:hypothetical protein